MTARAKGRRAGRMNKQERELEAWFQRYQGRYEAKEQLQAAAKRMGATPADRLRWILDFMTKDLDALQPEERIRLGYDLRGLVLLALPPDFRGKMLAKPMSDADVRRHQAAIAEGIRGLVGTPPRPWPLAAAPQLVVAGERLTKTGGARRRFAVRLGGDETASILGGVAHDIVALGEGLRACLECGEPFVGARKEDYCDPLHSIRARNKRRPPKKGGR
jgi:hypothetical protein